MCDPLSLAHLQHDPCNDAHAFLARPDLPPTLLDSFSSFSSFPPFQQSQSPSPVTFTPQHRIINAQTQLQVNTCVTQTVVDCMFADLTCLLNARKIRRESAAGFFFLLAINLKILFPLPSIHCFTLCVVCFVLFVLFPSPFSSTSFILLSYSLCFAAYSLMLHIIANVS